MIIVGGTYREVSSFPEKNVLFGSGLKAACAISSMVGDLTLYSAVSKQEQVEALATAASFNVKTSFVERAGPIEFHYLTPLTTPRIFGLGQTTTISAKSEGALVFGLLECDATVDAEKIVYDPQRPKGPSIDRTKLRCKQLAVVLNVHEARELSGSEDPEKAAQEIIKRYGAEVVIVKCGALGARVVDAKSSTWIGVFPSKRVWPVGSGDIFSGVFAANWLAKNLDPVSAARLASRAVSLWTESSDLLPIDPSGLSKLTMELGEKKPSVYLAGPFFNLAQNWLIENTRSALLNLGARVFSPLHEVGRGGDEVALPDLEGVDRSDSVLALLDGIDPGTIFEIGYAVAKGRKVIGFSQNNDVSELKMVRGAGVPIYSDYSTAVYHSIWAGM